MTTKVPSPRRSRAQLAAAALHDPVAFGELLGRFREFLRAEARRHLPPELRAAEGESDLVQETFLAACRNSASFRGHTEDELAGWLRAILRREALNHARAARAAAEDPGDPRAGFPLDVPDPGQVPPDEALVKEERDAIVREAVESLPAEYRTALDLRLRDRLSFGEIGRRLGRSAEAARKVFARAVDSVRRRFSRLDSLGQ